MEIRTEKKGTRGEGGNGGSAAEMERQGQLERRGRPAQCSLIKNWMYCVRVCIHQPWCCSGNMRGRRSRHSRASGEHGRGGPALEGGQGIGAQGMRTWQQPEKGGGCKAEGQSWQGDGKHGQVRMCLSDVRIMRGPLRGWGCWPARSSEQGAMKLGGLVPPPRLAGKLGRARPRKCGECTGFSGYRGGRGNSRGR